jgi:hypothetical protein
MKRYPALAAVVLLTAAGTFVTANKLRKPVESGFVVYQVVRSNGVEIDRITRSQKANGEWMEVKTNPTTGARIVQFGTKESGVVRVNNEKKENDFIGGWGAPLSAEQIRNDPHFVDEGEILGYRVMRIHMESTTDGSKTDLYRAPDLQGVILRVVSQNSDGSGFSIDPTKIERTDPEFALNNYPTTKELFNLRHGTN